MISSPIELQSQSQSQFDSFRYGDGSMEHGTWGLGRGFLAMKT